MAYARAALVRWAGEKIELTKQRRYVLMAIANQVGLEQLGTYTTTEELVAASGISSAAQVKEALHHLDKRMMIRLTSNGNNTWAIKLLL